MMLPEATGGKARNARNRSVLPPGSPPRGSKVFLVQIGTPQMQDPSDYWVFSLPCELCGREDGNDY